MDVTAGAAEGRIVVGVDGSDASLTALGWALGQAECTGGTVEAVSAWEPPDAFGGFPVIAETDWEADATAVLDATVAEAAGGHDVMRSTRRGHPVRVLLDAAAGAALLVVGNRGHGGFAGMLLGSVSQHLVAHAPCPVVVVRHLDPAR